jgi:hypothetical protein
MRTDSKSQQRNKKGKQHGMQWDTTKIDRGKMIGSDAKNQFRDIVSSKVVGGMGRM